MCKSAVLFSKRDYSLGEALRLICRNEKVNLVYCLTFPELLNNVISSNPEIIFYDAESNEFPYNIYREFKEANIFYVPKVVVLTNNPEKYNYEDEGLFIVDKRNFSGNVTAMLSKTKEREAKSIDPEKIECVRNKTTKLLSEIGITTKYLGYEYIRELVVIVYKDKRLLQSFNKKVYPKLAMRYNTQVNNVERNIRNAITVASQRSKNRIVFDEISGRSALNDASPIPSNKQFITWLLDKVS